MKIKMLIGILVAGAFINGCERTDVAGEYDYRIIPSTNTYDPNVTSYWKFDEKPAYYYDSRADSFNTYSSGSPINQSGRFGESYQPSSSDYMFVPSSSNTLLYARRFLVEAWVLPSAVAGRMAVISSCDMIMNNGWSFQLNDGRPEIWFVTRSNTARTVASAAVSVPADGNWHYIACIYGLQESASSEQKIFFYVDGVSEAIDLAASDFPLADSYNDLCLGHNWFGYAALEPRGDFFAGLIDEIAVWSLPDTVSWDSIEATLAERNGGMEYTMTGMLFY